MSGQGGDPTKSRRSNRMGHQTPILSLSQSLVAVPTVYLLYCRYIAIMTVMWLAKERIQQHMCLIYSSSMVMSHD
jgi:hypothetical protein